MAISRPNTMPIPFADGGGKNTIPAAASSTPGAASLIEGFPAVTRTPLVAGGVPPSGLDMNGILNLLSQHVVFLNGGGQYRFDAALVASQGGYPIGTVLQADDGLTQYLNILNNNTANFNTTPASIGVSWIPYSSGRLIGVRLITSTSTYTATPGTRSVVVELVGGGAAGGGAGGATGGSVSVGGGGGAGAYALKRITSGFSGVTVTVGAGGTGVSAGNGNAGGVTSFGALFSASGGLGGSKQGPAAQYFVAPGGSGASSTSNADIAAVGGGGRAGYSWPFSTTFATGGDGGDSRYGAGGRTGGNTAGSSGTGYGAGGGGTASDTGTSGANYAGGPGVSGAAFIWEYA